MELDPSPRNVMRVIREVLAVYGGPDYARLREAFREWVLGAAESWGIGDEVLEEVKSLKEAGMIYAGVEEQKEQAHLEGFTRGRIDLVCRMASQKLGARTAPVMDADAILEHFEDDLTHSNGSRSFVLAVGGEAHGGVRRYDNECARKRRNGNDAERNGRPLIRMGKRAQARRLHP